jgi:hypothetical protein
MARLFYLLNKEKRYKENYKKSIAAFTTFERLHGANPMSKEQNSRYVLIQNDLTYTE